MSETMRGIRARGRAATAWWGASIAALALSIGILIYVFWFVIVRGFPVIVRPSTYTAVTNGISGGLLNAIAGTVLLVAFGVVLAVLVGIGTGIWIAEFAKPRAARFFRFMTDVLAGVPSIVVGYFGYVLLVVTLGWQFSLFAGAIALAIIMLPYVIRSTDLALSAVPRELREGGIALGATPSTVLRTVSFPYALPGTLTGLLLGTGIAIGETAPLIYTAGWSNYLPVLRLTHSPTGYLTYVVWTFISQPFAAAHELAYGAAVLLMIMIFLTNVVARLLVERAIASRSGIR